ncbi:CRISPR-associated helicase, Cas3 family [Desulfocapsa sulfexigens DSM 10523]|uniref:CRISPR-associated helicase, Cas3 family n=1 Tax=Desulfocapsa sulfexigens (strain DSM 10523 / SB164P1) TaxID=1167006 RepID=M1PES3_DESSD|nr:CRISPR-associated helicase/endonuclease Cas3 [Desulfocapsa sulfexigens]AGF80047.1 CRISPR-associated helicase, Cas3 family [Desulfocapsa sulfexigens DSM 10523]
MKIAHAMFDEELQKLSPHYLKEHLQGVSLYAGNFSKSFFNSDWGRAAGLLHDLGKGSSEFQEYIRKVTGFECDGYVRNVPGHGPNHSSHGAVWANENLQGPGRVFAYLIAGHHAGLPDWQNEIGGGGCLSTRLTKDEVDKLPSLSASWLQEGTDSLLSPQSLPCKDGIRLDIFHLWVRMLFSCLVDADYLDTEGFMDKDKNACRSTQKFIIELKTKFDAYMDSLVSGAESTKVNILRQEILADCQNAAELDPGFFSLTVPTGGGKTLSGMAFALKHAIRHGKTRIIIVIPYTSIIEQTAQEYKNIFGEVNVLEHHSSLDPDQETVAARLASENWDAPIIVTTNVQLFESLFAAKSTKCRKLHNIVNSVIICDEAQMLPPEYLQPILTTMKGLVDSFNVSIVLCTATQPALTGEIGTGSARFTGIDRSKVREIINDPERLGQQFQRVVVQQAGKYEQWESLADELATYPQILCVVNTRKDCRDLHALMPEKSILLSANLCGEHRSKIIAEIKSALKNKKPIRVISTQLVEAGVDIDFPVVYRAMAGFDSIAQAAGRCNREGELQENGEKIKGKVVVFQAPKLAPPGFLRKGADAGSEIMRRDPEGCENLRPDTFQRYFKLFYGNGVASFDQKDMQSLLVKDAGRGEFQFRTAAQKFKLIDDQNQVAVVVWYSGDKTSGQQLIGQLKKYGPSRKLFRKMQRFTVSIPERQFAGIKDSVVEEVQGIWCQAVDYAYDETLGFVGLDMKPNDGAIII